MKRCTPALISLVTLVAGCGAPASSATRDHVPMPDDSRAFAACGKMRNTQAAESCDRVINHMPICEKTCVNFTSEYGDRVTFECLRTGPVQDTGSRCNYHNTWNP